jgi:hypothetical protein
VKPGWLTLANVSTWLDAHLSDESISGQIMSNVNLVQAELHILVSEALRVREARMVDVGQYEHMVGFTFSNDSISGQTVSNINLVQPKSENLGCEALRVSEAQEA